MNSLTIDSGIRIVPSVIVHLCEAFRPPEIGSLLAGRLVIKVENCNSDISRVLCDNGNEIVNAGPFAATLEMK